MSALLIDRMPDNTWNRLSVAKLQLTSQQEGLMNVFGQTVNSNVSGGVERAVLCKANDSM